MRAERVRVIVDDLHVYLEARLRQVSAKSKLADAICYAITRWTGLSLSLDDGRVELNSNAVERSIRPLALNRKNALFASSEEGGDNWAVIARLIEKCKISGINPHVWLTDTLTRLAAGHPANAVGELMPWTAVAWAHRLRNIVASESISNPGTRRKCVSQDLQPFLITPSPAPLRYRTYRQMTHRPLLSTLLRARLEAVAK